MQQVYRLQFVVVLVVSRTILNLQANQKTNKNKWDKQTTHRPCPRDEYETQEFEVLDTTNHVA
jgi:hypothetical protein